MSYPPLGEEVIKILGKLHKENPQLFDSAHQEPQGASAREWQERMKARLFQREVASAAAASTAGEQLTVQPLRQQPQVSQPSSSKTQATYRDNMGNEQAMDSLIVKILGKIQPPSQLTKELRDLVLQIPVALHTERTAAESRVNQPKNDNKNHKNAGKDAEIHKLKTEKGQLVADIKRLEAGFRQRKIPVPTIYTPRAILDGPSARPPFNNSTTVASAGKLGAAGPSVSANTRSVTKIEVGQQQITKTGANQDPVLNLQPRFQNRVVSPPKDPRPHCYTASAAGFYYDSSKPANVLQGNDKQAIHSSRLGQMDESSGPKLYNRKLAASIAEARGKAAGTPSSGPSSSQIGATQQGGAPSRQGLNPPTTRSALPNEMWQSRFGKLASTGSSQDSQLSASYEAKKTTSSTTQDPRLIDRGNASTSGKKRAASPSFQGDAAKKAKVDAVDGRIRAPDVSQDDAAIAENRRLYVGNLPYATTKQELQDFFKGYLVEDISIPTKAGTTHPDGHAFVDISTPAAAKRANEELNGKTILCCKVSVQLIRQPELASNTRDHRNGAFGENTNTISQLNEDIERTEERHIESKHYREPLRASSDSELDVVMANTTPKYKAPKRSKSLPADCSPKDTSTIAAKSSPAQKERRDSGVVISGASIKAVAVGTPFGRQLTCMSCRVAKLQCDGQTPCQHCDASKTCVFVTCPYAEDCISIGCFYAHDKAEYDDGRTKESAMATSIDAGAHA